MIRNGQIRSSFHPKQFGFCIYFMPTIISTLGGDRLARQTRRQRMKLLSSNEFSIKSSSSMLLIWELKKMDK